MSSPIEAGLVSEAKEVFLQWLLKVKEPGDFTDFIIACGDLQWKVDRNVVCSHSDYFWKACQSGFKEGEMGSIVLKEENPEVIAKLVDYFYKFDYDDGNNDNQQQPIAHGSAPRKLAFNALMYVAGDKYDIGGLKLLAKAKFAAALVDGWNKEDLPEVIRFIYENTVSSDRELRECLVPTLIQHKQALRSDDAFRKVVGTVGEFAVDLIDAWTVPNHQGSQTSFLQCNYCLKLYPNTHTGVCQGSGYHCRSYEPTLRVVYTPP